MINVIFILLSLLNLLLPAQDEVINKLQEKFSSLNYYQADFKQIESGSGNILLSGKFLYKKSGQYRLELKRNTIICNGESIWNYDIERNKVVISNLEDDPLSFSLEEYIFEYPSKCRVSYEQFGGDKNIIVMHPNDNSLSFETAKLYINSSLYLEKIEIQDLNGNKIQFVFSNIIIDRPVKNDLFNFQPTEGTKIIDLR